MAAHKHWRIYSLSSNGGSEIGFNEIEMAATVGGADLTAGQVYTSSSNYGGGFTADKAFDDNGSTEFVSASGQWAWIGVEFSTPQTIRDLRMKCRTGLTTQTMKGILFIGCDDSSFNPYTSKIYLMIDDVGAWTSGAFKNITVPVNPIPDNVSSTPRTTWRVLIPLNNGDSVLSLAELEMAASAGGADLLTGGTPLASAANASFPIANLFDNNATTAWVTPNTHRTAWVQYQVGSAAWMAEMRWQARNTTPTQAPLEAYILAGAGTDYDDTNTDWVVAGRVASQNSWTVGQTRVHAINNTLPPASVRAYAVAASVLRSGPSSVRVYGAAVPVLRQDRPPIRVYGMAVSVLRSIADAPPDEPGMAQAVNSEWVLR